MKFQQIFIALSIAIALLFSFTALNAYPAAGKTNVNTYVIGHKSPDTDSIVGAIAAARYYGYIPARIGALNPESKYILDRYGFAAPELIKDIRGKKFMLVDFNAQSQGPNCLKSQDIIAIIDHHAMTESSYKFNRPLDINTKPWGSVATIIASQFFSANRTIDHNLAGLMLGAILSDTSNLDRSKATKHDHLIVEKLAAIIKMSPAEQDQFFKEMIKAKSNLNSLSMLDIVQLDYKQFVINGYFVGIGVAETITPHTLIQKRKELVKALEQVKGEQALDFILFSVTDVRDGHEAINLITIPGSPEEKLAEDQFGAYINNVIRVPGQTSRKRYIQPQFTKRLNKLPTGNYQPEKCQ